MPDSSPPNASEPAIQAQLAPRTIDTRATWPQRLFRSLTTLATIGFHVGAAVTVIFVRPRRSDVLAALGFYLVGMFIITAGYHRYFAHRSYKTSRVMQALLALLGCFCTQKGALWWAATHRQHHRHTDTPLDPHSPHQRGFWHSHIFWTLSSEYEGYDPNTVRDLAKFPELRWLDRYCTVPLAGYIALCWLIGGARGVGWWYLVPTVALMHAVMLVNSAGHLVGRQLFSTGDYSRNSIWLALLTLGEGWHNNHHRYPGSARQGFYWWQIDVTYYVLCMLRRLGLIRDLREPPAHILREGRMPVGESNDDATQTP